MVIFKLFKKANADYHNVQERIYRYNGWIYPQQETNNAQGKYRKWTQFFEEEEYQRAVTR